jgi:hypothetical protein
LILANPDHLEKLSKGPVVWNVWRKENPHIIPDLSHVTLSLDQRQLGPSKGGPIDLRGANLEGATLRFATLTGADLEGAKLTGVDLMHARLDHAKLIATDFTDAVLDHVDFTEANMKRAIIIGATLINARNLTQAQVNSAYGDASTLLPAALKPPLEWFPEADEEELSLFTEDREEDPYDILGLEKAATVDEIRGAHRNLVKKLHPDVNPSDTAAAEQFKKVSAAYHILSDPDKRLAYDKGEIDSEGRARPEYEAQQEFRRYAFRFYAAAVLSVLLAGGALVFAWNAVLRNVGNHAVVITGSKSAERLGATSVRDDGTTTGNAESEEPKPGAVHETAPEMQKTPADNSAAPKSETIPAAEVSPALPTGEQTQLPKNNDQQKPVAPPGDGTQKIVVNQPSPPPSETKTPQEISKSMEGPSRPLSEGHKEVGADGAQIPSVGFRAPKGQENLAAPQTEQSTPAVPVAEQPKNSKDVAVLPKKVDQALTEVSSADPTSEKGNSETTGSIKSPAQTKAPSGDEALVTASDAKRSPNEEGARLDSGKSKRRSEFTGYAIMSRDFQRYQRIERPRRQRSQLKREEHRSKRQERFEDFEEDHDVTIFDVLTGGLLR